MVMLKGSQIRVVPDAKAEVSILREVTFFHKNDFLEQLFACPSGHTTDKATKFAILD